MADVGAAVMSSPMGGTMFGRSLPLTFLFVLVTLPSLRAQQPQPAGTTTSVIGSTEVGGTFGVGSAGTTEYTNSGYLVGGVEACARCSGKFAAFAEFNHWRYTPKGYQTSTWNLGAGGLRIQGRGRRARPFFDVGLTVTVNHLKQQRFIHKQGDYTRVGVAIGVGTAVSISNRWYIRPQGRLAVLSNGGVSALFNVGVGYRF